MILDLLYTHIQSNGNIFFKRHQLAGADLGLGKGGFFFVRSNHVHFKPHPSLIIHCIEMDPGGSVQLLDN